MDVEERMSNDEPVSVSGPLIENIGQIAIAVSDLQRAKDFYGGMLGLRHLFDAGTMAFFACGEVRLMLGAQEKPTPGGGTILYFRVDEIHAAHATLEARGAVFTHKPHLVAKMPDHELWMAFLADPDGNPVALMCEAR